MQNKVMEVFYDGNGYPFKDKELQVRYPIIGNSFVGASLTNEIRFYVDNLGVSQDIEWVANTKRADGKYGWEILTLYRDTTTNKHYLKLQLSGWYTAKQGDIYITLNGYQGGVALEYNEDDDIYTPVGQPIIQATGSVKIAINYAVPPLVGDDSLDTITVQDALGLVADKLGKKSPMYIKVIDSVANINAPKYADYLDFNDYVFDSNTNIFYKLVEEGGLFEASEVNFGEIQAISFVAINLTTENLSVSSFANVKQLDNKTLATYIQEVIANQDIYALKSNTYTKDEVYNKTETYNKTEVYNKSETYSQTEVDNIIIDTKEYVDTFGKSLVVSINTTTYVITIALKDKNGNTLSTQSVDLPLEQMVVGGSYDSATQKIILELNNGNTIEIPVADLVSGLVSETQLNTILADYYTKSQIDTAFGNVYTKSQIDSALSGKVDKTTTIAGIGLSANISATDLTNALNFMNDTTDLDYVMGD